jgi:Glycosyl hydrolases family 15
LHWGVAWLRAALALLVAGALGAMVVSGGSSADPRTPPSLPGLPPPFLGTAVVGGGGLTGAVDAYGDVVDLRAGPAGKALIDHPAERQTAGTVAADTGIVPRVSIDRDGRELPLWRADSIRQRYRPATNVLVTEARFGSTEVEIVYAAEGDTLACLTRSSARIRVSIDAVEAAARPRLRCDSSAARAIITTSERADRRWLARARPLGPGAPPWAKQAYRRSLLTLRALTDRRTGAVAAGARDGWAYVWPRDAGTAALAFAAAGYRPEARRVAHFLLELELSAAARFHGDGTPVPGREAQGDAAGWTAAAARAAGLPSPDRALPWRNRSDYQEGGPGDYLANVIASGPGAGGSTPSIWRTFQAHRPGLVRRAGDADSGLDSAAAWGVQPFPQQDLFPAVRRTLLRLAAQQSRFGITPGEDWDGIDPWTAPTAWTAWSLAALGERRAALHLLAALRRASTSTGALPERVDAQTGIPTSTTPLAWSHAFAILALRQLWPNRASHSLLSSLYRIAVQRTTATRL